MVLNYNEFFVDRRLPERRQERQLKPPFLTEEGFVLVDRRGSEDRRGGLDVDALIAVEASSLAM